MFKLVSPRARSFRVLSSVVAIFAFALLTGCAYFNTFYNARLYYKQGLEAEEVREGGGQQEFKKSLEKAVVVVREYPDSRWADDAFFVIAMNYYWLGNYEKAETQFEGFIEFFPESKYWEEAKLYHALSIARLKRYSESRLALQEMFDSKRFGEKARFEWAMTFKAEEDWEGARQAFEDFLSYKKRGDLASAARLNLAEMELKGGDTLSAIQTYERFLKRAETSKENLQRTITLSELYYLQGHYRSARKTLNKTTGIYDEIDDQAILLTGKIKLAQGDSIGAERNFHKVEKTEPKAEALYLLASIYEGWEDYPKAIAYLDTLTTRYSKYDYATIGKRKKALLESRLVTDTTDSIQIDPAQEQFMLAQSYLLELGNPMQAVEEYRIVVLEYPESKYAPQALYAIAWINKFKLKKNVWEQDVAKLTEMYPESTEASEAKTLLLGIEPEIEYEEEPSDSG